MPRNKLPQEQKKVRWMTIYVDPKAIPRMDKSEVNQLINRLQSESLSKCADEALKSKL